MVIFDKVISRVTFTEKEISESRFILSQSTKVAFDREKWEFD